jgi:membrane protease YdiL (CAAX protease family)
MFLDDQLPPQPPAREPEERVDQPRWRGIDIVLGVALLMGGYVLLVIVFSAVSAAVEIEILQDEFTYGTAAMLIVTEAWIGLTVLIVARRRRMSFADIGFRMPRRGWVMPAAVVGAYASLALYTIAVEVIDRVTGSDLGGLMEGNPLPTGDYDVLLWVLLGIGVVLIAPVAEELFFRGLLFKALDRMWPTFLAMLVSGIAFSLLHLNVSVLVPFAMIGIIFAWAFRRADSLWTPIGAHGIVNGVSFILTVVGVEA